MEQMDIREICRAAGVQNPPQASLMIPEITTDSREIPQGSLFIALEGERFDGHVFIPQALEKGAAFVLAHHPVEMPEDERVLFVPNTQQALLDIAAAYRNRFAVKMVGVTGSVGKTTTKEMIWTALSAAMPTLKTLGNMNNEIGFPKTLLRLTSEHQAAVVEMGMSGFNEIRPLAKAARLDTAVLTNIGVSHMERLGSRENILKAKLEILEGVLPGGTGLFNLDNDLLSGIHPEQLGFQRVTYGIHSPEADYRAVEIAFDRQGAGFTICSPEGEFAARLPCVGEHNVLNALAAFAVGRRYGVPAASILKALQGYVPAGMRQRMVSHNGMTIVEDCYNASPDSMLAAFSALDQTPCGEGGKKILVLSDMLELGEISRKAHWDTGKAAAQSGADLLLAYGPEAKAYIEGAKASGMKQAYWLESKEALTQRLAQTAKPGDLLWLKASRGMALEDVLAPIYSENP